jgi:hypothetical protein
MKIISGGQTGIDQAALIVGKAYGFETGGTAPLGWRTTAGNNQKLLEALGLTESKSWNYAVRTIQNIKDSDCTIRIFELGDSPGEVLTKKACEKAQKPLIDFPMQVTWRYDEIETILFHVCSQANELGLAGIRVVNFAGNSEKTCPGIFVRSLPLIGRIMTALQEILKGSNFR